MNTDDREIKHLMDRRQLVSIFRKPIDPGFGMQGFIVSFSKRYLLFHYVHKFFVDGLLLVNRSHIRDIVCDHAHLFQRQLLESEGAIDGINFEASYPVSSLPDFLNSLPPDEIVILEEEAIDEPTWNIGRFVDITPGGNVRIHGFSANGVWDDDLLAIDVARVSCCQIQTNYIGLYTRYFKTQTIPAKPAG